MFLAARAVGDKIAADVYALDPMLVPSWIPQNVSGEELIAFAKKAVDAGGLAVFCFHGVGGGHSIDVPARPTASSSPGSTPTGRRSGRTPSGT
jgi:hypothetical protein